MLKVTSRPQIQSTRQSTQTQIQFRQDLPNRLKPIVKALYNPIPNYFNAKLLKSQYCVEILQYAVSWPSLESFYPNTTKTSTNSHIPMLKQLTVISFPNLQYLYLENMKLDNFQFLQFIESPNLKTLYLMENHARILKSLGKVNWKKLEKLEISYQFGVQELKCLERMRFGPNGKVINPMIDQDVKRRKKIDENKTVNSLLMVWPKLEPKQYGHLVEEMLKKRNKIQ